jgi:hypothetical protein
MSNILVIRGYRVLLDSDLAALYQVETKALTRAVRRNAERFPGDFIFQLAAEESGSLRSQFGALKTGRGKHRKYAPYVFTEQGVAMLSSVLNSERAVQVNIEVMRAFVRLRETVHTPITLGVRPGTKPLVFKLRRRSPCGFDSHRPLHFQDKSGPVGTPNWGQHVDPVEGTDLEFHCLFVMPRQTAANLFPSKSRT